MKKWTRVIAAILTGTVLVQSVALADEFSVTVVHVTESGSEVIYEGDISDFNGFTIPWGTEKQDYNFGIFYDWDSDDDSYYTITPRLQETPPLLTDIAKAPAKGSAINNFSDALIPGQNLEQNIPAGAIQLPAADVAEGIAAVDLAEEPEPPLAAEPVVINGVQDQSPTLLPPGMKLTLPVLTQSLPRLLQMA